MVFRKRFTNLCLFVWLVGWFICVWSVSYGRLVGWSIDGSIDHLIDWLCGFCLWCLQVRRWWCCWKVSSSTAFIFIPGEITTGPKFCFEPAPQFVLPLAYFSRCTWSPEKSVNKCFISHSSANSNILPTASVLKSRPRGHKNCWLVGPMVWKVGETSFHLVLLFRISFHFIL